MLLSVIGARILIMPLTQHTDAKQISAPRIQPQEFIFTHGSREKNDIALTFDADMTESMLRELKNGQVKSWYDTSIVQTLTARHIPATIFVTGLWAETYPDALKDIAKNPLFEIGNHSYDHDAFSVPCYHLKKAEDKKSEILKTQKIIHDLTGITPTLFRFPGGCFNSDDVNLVRSLDLTVVGWDVVSKDAFQKNKQAIIYQTLHHVENGSVIIMHLNGNRNAPETGDALGTVIDSLQKEGFHFVTVSQLIQKSL